MHPDDDDVGPLHPGDDWRLLPDLLPNGQINPVKAELRRKWWARKRLDDEVAAAVGWTPRTHEQKKQAAMEWAGLVAQRCRERRSK